MVRDDETEAMQRYFVTFVGVGAGLSPELGNNNVLIENAARNANLLIDCGPITACDLKLEGRLKTIQRVLLTHVHDDHVGGLQLWGQLNRYVYRHKPELYFPEALYEELWDGTLRGSLEKVSTHGEAATTGLSGYFDPHSLDPAKPLVLPELPTVGFLRSLHVPGKASYSLFLGEDVFYSSDSQLLPPAVGPSGKPLRVIFQDCQLFETGSDVHTPLARLERELPPEQKAITYLMHYNHAPDVDARALGFAGFVRRGETIEI